MDWQWINNNENILSLKILKTKNIYTICTNTLARSNQVYQKITNSNMIFPENCLSVLRLSNISNNVTERDYSDKSHHSKKYP